VPRKKKRPAPIDPTRPRRRSVWITPDLGQEIRRQAHAEERKESDMIRILIQRGLRASRTTPSPPNPATP
jgi:hypothetical protein